MSAVLIKVQLLVSYLGFVRGVQYLMLDSVRTCRSGLVQLVRFVELS